MNYKELHPKTLKFLETKGFELMDLSPLTDLVDINFGVHYTFTDRRNSKTVFVLCKCGFIDHSHRKKSLSVYTTYPSKECPLCGNRQFRDSNSKKIAENQMNISEQKLIPSQFRGIKVTEDLSVRKINDNTIRFSKSSVTFRIDFMNKKVIIDDKEIKEWVFAYENGVWVKLSLNEGTSTYEKEDMQSYGEFFITINSLFSGLKKELQTEHIEKFLAIYNEIVPNDKVVKFFDGLQTITLTKMLLSRNFYVVHEFFQLNFNLFDELVYQDFMKKHKENIRVYYSNSSSYYDYNLSFSKKYLNGIFKSLPLSSYVEDNTEVFKQLNIYLAKQPGNEQFSFRENKLRFENIYKILELPKTIVFTIKTIFDKHREELKNKDNSSLLFNLIKEVKKGLDKHAIPVEEMVNMINVIGLDSNIYNFVYALKSKHPTKKPHKIAVYLMNVVGFKNVGDAFTNYRDYINMSEKLELNFTIFPKNLIRVHDIRVVEFNIMKSEKEAIKFNNFYSNVKLFDEQEFYEIDDSDYVILKPKSSHDLMKEGQALNHCVGSYAEAVIQGRSLIFFLRKKNDKQKSLVTIEISPKTLKVVQSKGRYNRSVTKPEKEAIDRWHRKMVTEVKKDNDKMVSV